MPSRLAFLVLCLAQYAVTSTSSEAQPFSAVEVAVGPSAAIWAPGLSQRWTPGAGVQGYVRAPFYAGQAEVGAVAHGHRSRDASVPSFGAAFAFAGWGFPIGIGPVEAFAGGRLGLYLMVFDEARAVRQRSPSESEMAFAPVVAMHVPLGDTWSAFGAAQHVVVLTAVRFELTQVTVGVRRTFEAPGWLEALLR